MFRLGESKRIPQAFMKLTYLGEDKPAVLLVAERLRKEQAEGRLDWDKTWVFVPTQESSLRLKQALLEQSPEGGLLPPRIGTPEAFLESLHQGGQSGAFLSWALLCSWASVILEEECPNALVMLPPKQKTWAWAFDLAETCLKARRALGEEAIALKGQFLPASLEDKEYARWKLLSRWEAKVEKRWQKLGLEDPLSVEIAWAHHPYWQGEATTVIFACVPDPLPLVMRGMQTLAEEGALALDIWVQASEGSFGFDSWGRPLSLKEGSEAVLDYSEAKVSLSGDALGMAEAVTRFFEEEGSSASQSAVGVCDRSFYPQVESCLEEAGWPPYCSFGYGLKRTGLWKFVEAMQQVLKEPKSVEAFMALGRSRVLQVARGLEAYEACQEWDEIEALYVPSRVETLKKLIKKEKTRALFAAVQEELTLWQADVAAALESLIARLRAGGWAGAYQERLLEALSECGQLLPALRKLEQKDPLGQVCPEIDLLKLLMQKHRLFKERSQCALPAEDWLELIYEPAAVLALMGVHEGTFAQKKREDVFLPESLKQRLGLRGRAQGEALNFFLMRSLLLSRKSRKGIAGENSGKLGIFLAKVNPSGEPCVPSGLLFYIPEEQLAQQALTLFAEEKAKERPEAYSREKWHLKRVQPPSLLKEGECGQEVLRISPSLMKGFLTCPKRFFLSSYGKDRSLQLNSTLPSYEVGNFIHELAKDLTKKEVAAYEDSEQKLLAYLENKAQALLSARWKRSQEELSLLISVQYRYILERLSGLARLHREACQEGWEVVATEEAFAWRPWADLPVEINLRMDRIEYHAGKKELRVLDIKTKGQKDLDKFSPRLQHWKTKMIKKKVALFKRYFPQISLVCEMTPGGRETFFRWCDVQLALYRVALKKWAQEKGLEVRAFSAGYMSLPLLGRNAECQIWEDLEEEHLSSALDWCREVAERILGGREEDFPLAEELGWPVPPYSEFNAWAPEGLALAFEEKKTLE